MPLQKSLSIFKIKKNSVAPVKINLILLKRNLFIETEFDQ